MKSMTKLVILVLVLTLTAMAFIGAGVYLSLRALTQAKPEAQSAPVVVDGSVQGFYNQQINWHPCEAQQVTHPLMPELKNLADYECATVQAPLDWDQPDKGDPITLSVAVHRSGVPNAPALFFNLGGPGGPAVRSLASQVRDSMGSALIDKYDIVAVDPRGVGASTPVQCLTDHEVDNKNAYGVISDADVEKVKVRAREGVELSPEEQIAEEKRLSLEFAQGCQKMSGELAAHVDTPSVARDFDMVREILGQEKLNYLGYSYGTFLGATYAELFPSTVGLMVLDSAVDPAMSLSELAALQMKGFDESLKHWIEDCQSGPACPLPGDVRQGIERIKAFLQRLDREPLPTADPDRPLTKMLALNAMIGAMYDEQYYTYLTQGITQAFTQNDGSILLRFVDLLSSRGDDGKYYNNSNQAIIAVNSLDFPAQGTEKDWIPQAQQLRSELDIVGDFVTFDNAALSVWPFEGATERKQTTADGAPPILVVGQTHDPATPYVMSQNLAGHLRSGVLLTVEGWSHGSYNKLADQCVIDAVEGYLVDGVVPEAGTTCK